MHAVGYCLHACLSKFPWASILHHVSVKQKNEKLGSGCTVIADTVTSQRKQIIYLLAISALPTVQFGEATSALPTLPALSARLIRGGCSKEIPELAITITGYN